MQLIHYKCNFYRHPTRGNKFSTMPFRRCLRWNTLRYMMHTSRRRLCGKLPYYRFDLVWCSLGKVVSVSSLSVCFLWWRLIFIKWFRIIRGMRNLCNTRLPIGFTRWWWWCRIPQWKDLVLCDTTAVIRLCFSSPLDQRTRASKLIIQGHRILNPVESGRTCCE